MMCVMWLLLLKLGQVMLVICSVHPSFLPGVSVTHSAEPMDGVQQLPPNYADSGRAHY